jgi:hypothetical protein
MIINEITAELIQPSRLTTLEHSQNSCLGRFYANFAERVLPRHPPTPPDNYPAAG